MLGVGGAECDVRGHQKRRGDWVLAFRPVGRDEAVSQANVPATPANPTSRSGTVQALPRPPLCPNIAMPMATVSSPRHVQPLAGIRHASAYGKSHKPQA